MPRYYLSRTIVDFLNSDPKALLGEIVQNNEFAVELSEGMAFTEEIRILQTSLIGFSGSLYFEYSIPRMGKRIDVVCIIGPVIFILEFKVGEEYYYSSAIDQVVDYALDLKNFHQTSHEQYIAPILIATKAEPSPIIVATTIQNDKLLFPIRCNAITLRPAIEEVLKFVDGEDIDVAQWEQGQYHPTPTIVEAAIALYRTHSVADITRKDADAINLSHTSNAITEIIEYSQKNAMKSICFVTGVPGSGKTLVGLNIATKHINKENELYSVYLSGNGPLVAVLREALARDKVEHEKLRGNPIRKGEALRDVKMFIQNIHHFRDSCLQNRGNPPLEHVVLFDEAQRAWTLEQLANFMVRKKHIPDFNQSEPEFLISCLDWFKDWAVIVCLVGGGQEINTGEAGIGEWLRALNHSFQNWQIYISSRLTDNEYGAQDLIEATNKRNCVTFKDELHLAVSMRSFRAENMSLLVKQILDFETESAKHTLSLLYDKYPIVLTRNLKKAKEWLRVQARGTERYGIIVSSQAERLKPHAIDVRSPIDPIHWFLDGKGDVRSSYYLEAVATEFDIQGLELDWACVTWDADFRYSNHGWEHKSFVGDRWFEIKKPDRKSYQKNAYRVLLTRARQGMVIVVPEGDAHDPTRNPAYYDPTYEYLRRIGFPVI